MISKTLVASFCTALLVTICSCMAPDRKQTDQEFGGSAGDGGSANGGTENGGTSGEGGSAGFGGTDVGGSGGTGAGGTAGTCTPSGTQCGLFPQSGCGAGMSCDVADTTTGQTACYCPKNASLGNPCQSQGECVSGLSCVDHQCRKLCSIQSDCSSNAPCYQVISTSGVVPGWYVCTDQCDLRTNNGCVSGLQCYPYGVDSNQWDVNPGFSVCGVAGGSTTTCSTYYASSKPECSPGYGCYGSKCYPWCRDGHPEDCSKSCVGFWDGSTGHDYYVGTQKFGLCK